MKDHLILQYRESISERYDYDRIKGNPGVPSFFTKKNVTELKTFFLENLYTAPEKRAQLDAAFTQLESYVAHPTKIWGVMGNLTSAIFQFGFQFPAAIKAAVSALETHSAARHFEDALLHAAVRKKFKVPLTDEQFMQCLAAIPKKQADKFIDDLAGLFRVISNSDLLLKTIEIMKDVLKRMEEKDELYTTDDTDAIELGIDIFEKGYKLLEKYDDEMKEELVEYIIKVESEFIKSLHRKVEA